MKYSAFPMWEKNPILSAGSKRAEKYPHITSNNSDQVVNATFPCFSFFFTFFFFYRISVFVIDVSHLPDELKTDNITKKHTSISLITVNSCKRCQEAQQHQVSVIMKMDLHWFHNLTDMLVGWLQNMLQHIQLKPVHGWVRLLNTTLKTVVPKLRHYIQNTRHF